MQPREALRGALKQAEGPALVAFLTAGYPEPEGFLEVLGEVEEVADAVEIGVPFSDPMADGITIQRSSQGAIEKGVSLRWILDQLATKTPSSTPLLLMSYLNPLLAFGYETLAARASEVGVSGFIVPDLPYEESAPLKGCLDAHGLALVQLVTPATPPERLSQLCRASEGFVYAVTRTGITGGETQLPAGITDYLGTVKKISPVPVCAGFGVRSRDDVELIGQHADGVIVGSALVEALERGESPSGFLKALRP
jgi:tryptophan synthase alpha chain